MKALSDFLMNDEWVWLHVKPCAERGLKEEIVKSLILPKINELLAEGCDERQFTARLATEFEKNDTRVNFQTAFDCIEQRIIFEAERHEMSLVGGWAQHMCAALLGKYFHGYCKRTGYAKAM